MVSVRIDRVAFAVAATRADLTSGQIATESGLSPATVSAVKNGKSCTMGTAMRIADALGVTVEDLTREPGNLTREPGKEE